MPKFMKPVRRLMNQELADYGPDQRIAWVKLYPVAGCIGITPKGLSAKNEFTVNIKTVWTWIQQSEAGYVMMKPPATIKRGRP